LESIVTPNLVFRNIFATFKRLKTTSEMRYLHMPQEIITNIFN